MTERILELAPFQADPSQSPYSDPGRMRVTVVFTNIAGTLAALEAASKLARNLNAEIVLLLAEEIYFRYSLEHPPVPAGFFETLCLAMVDELELEFSASRIEIRFCRDQVQCLLHALSPRSLVVVGRGRRWWNARERKVERALTRFGHSVLRVYADGRSSKSRAHSVACRMLAS